MARLNVSIIGTTGPDPRYWPGTVFASDLAEAVILTLAAGSRSAHELATEFHRSDSELGAIVNQLLDLRAVRTGEDGRLSLRFSFLTRQDLKLLDVLVPPLGESLADCVLRRASAIERALGCLPDGRSLRQRAEYAFATVGCMGLDWAGIATLRRSGHLSAGTEYPDGGRYVLIGEEKHDVRRSRDYCGSRTDGGERYFFTSFGDHSGPRHCLPDLFFQAEGAIGRASWPPGVGPDVSAALKRGMSGLYDEMGSMVVGQAVPEGPCAKLLDRVGYLRDGKTLVLVFRQEAFGAVQRVVTAVVEAVGEWAMMTVPELGRMLGPLTPIRHGVDRGHFLNHVWHFIFAEANRILAERGFMLDPEPGPDGQGRYLAWVAEADLYRALLASHAGWK